MATRFYSSVEYGNARGSSDPDVLYFNATINNNNTTDSTPGTAPQITATYQRTYPLIQDASDFMTSVVRMSNNGATRNLPILIPQIQGSTIEGTQWLGSVTGNLMSINSTPPPILSVGQAFTGSGTAILVSPTGARVGTIPYTILLGADGNPIKLLVPPATPAGPWGLSSTLAQGFWPGGNGYPGGFYNVSALLNGFFFVGSAQADIDLTAYSFTIVPCVAGVPSGAPAQVFVEWETQEPSTRPPSSPVITQELGNEYYYLYSYDWWLTLCNKALAQAYVDAGVSVPNGEPRIVSAFEPADNAGERLFRIETQGAYFAPGDSGNFEFRLYMNTNMANLFSNFPGTWDNESDGRSFQVYLTQNEADTTAFGSLPPSSFQEFGSTSSWTPVDALVLTTSALPIVAEQITPPSLVGASDTGFNRGVSESAFQSVLLDVPLREIAGAGDWRKSFVYEPTGEYRMVSLTTQSSPISHVDIFGWWRNRLDDGLYPLRLSNGSSLSLKLMFRRKQMGV